MGLVLGITWKLGYSILDQNTFEEFKTHPAQFGELNLTASGQQQLITLSTSLPAPP